MLERERTQLTETEILAQAPGRRDEVRGGARGRRQAALGGGQERQRVHGERARAAGHAQERAGAPRRGRQARRGGRAPRKKSIEQHEADFAALKEHVAGEAKAANEKIAEFDAQIAEERKLRDVAAARVRPDVLKKYSAIRMRRGLAMAPVKNGTCQGCNMNIPPQLFNLLQRGDSIELCGNCNRIIYWDKLLENPDGAPAEPKEKPQS